MDLVGKNVSGYNLFFVMPEGGRDVHKSAKKLIGIKRVREVLITEGDCGFVVKADPDTADGNLNKEISKAVGGSSRMVMCHCQYKR